jgi:acyl-homoserine-lactone acylase
MKCVRVGIVICLLSFLVKAQPMDRIDPSAIDIVRDQWGVPHIFAKRDAEVAYGLAWAHSEDDFHTIQKSFLASRSMLGMVTGREGAMVDYVVHLLHLRDLVDSMFDQSISPEFKLVLNGYSQGLNAYAESHPKEIFVRKLFPITPKDVLTYSILQLAVGCGVDEALKKIYRGKMPLAQEMVMEHESDGSNAFAFNSKITEDKNVYLAINTHHPLEGQVSWYEVHMASEEGLNIVGSLFPGSPVIFTGINENLGWTHTVNHPDRLDVYQLQLRSANSLDYNVDGVWHTLKEETVKLRIKLPGFNLHVKRKIYSSIYGPTVKTTHGTFALRTAGIMDIRALEQWHRMNKSATFTEFKQALNMQAFPGYNIMYGDRFDTIYYISNARLPIRDTEFNWKQTLPGNTKKTLWTKFHSIEELPQLLNPSSGYLFNANHSPFRASSALDNLNQQTFDSTMGYETHDNNRSLRFYELMANRKKIDYETFKKIKYDVQLPKKLAFPVDIDSLFLLDPKKYPAIADIIQDLNTWDRVGTTDSHGAAIFAIGFYKIAAVYQNSNESLKRLSESMCVQTLSEVKEYMLKNFGSTEITLGDYQRLERGNKSMALGGLPDVLAAMYSTPTKNGTVRGTVGDCYIAFAKFTAQGPEIESINCFGASTHPSSKHYDDQMPLFQQQQTKKMTLNRIENYQHAERIYHPQAYSRVASAKLARANK